MNAITLSGMLLDASMKSAVILAGAWMGALAARRASAAARHLIWTIACAAALLGPIVSRMVPAPQVGILRPPPTVVTISAPVSVRPDVAISVAAQSVASPPPVASVSTPPTNAHAAAQYVAPNTAPSISPSWSWQELLLAVWSAGAALVLCRWVIASILLRRMARGARIVSAGPLWCAMQQSREELCINRRVRLLELEGQAMPCVWGIVRSRLLLPAQAIDWSAARLRSVLLHELAHVKRWDCATQAVGEFTCAIYWFNPLAWLAAWRMRREREQACDDVVLNRGWGADDYAELLLDMARGFRASPVAAVAMARRSGLRIRVARILDGGANRQSLTRRLIVAAAIVAMVFFTPLGLIRLAIWSEPAKAADATQGNRAIGGVVEDELGNPIAGATIWIGWQYPDAAHQTAGGQVNLISTSKKVLTDNQGKWTFDGIPAEFVAHATLTVNHPDYLSQRLPTPPAEKLFDKSAVLEMSSGVEVSGRVTNDRGESVARAKVVSKEYWGATNIPVMTATTDNDGRYVLRHIADGYIVRVTAPGYAPASTPIQTKERMYHLDVALSPGRTAHGRVIDAKGNPVSGVTVKTGLWDGVMLDWTGTTDRDGRFEMPDAPADIAFDASRRGYETGEVRLAAGQDEALIQLRQRLTLHGTVTDAVTGAPIPDFSVIEGAVREDGQPSFSFGTPRSYKDGRFTFSPDIYVGFAAAKVLIEADGHLPMESMPFADGGDVTQSFALTPASDIAGQVLYSDGTPAAGAEVYMGIQTTWVTFQGSTTDAPYRAIADANGRFHFGPQSGQIFLIARNDRGYCDQSVAPDQVGNVKLTLHGWSRIEGHYLPSGQAAGPLRVDVSPLEQPAKQNYWWTFNTTVGSDGAFSVDHVPQFGDGGANLMVGGINLGASYPAGGTFHVQVGTALNAGQGTLVFSTTRPGIRLDGVTVTGTLLPKTPADKVGGASGQIAIAPAPSMTPHQWPADIHTAASLTPRVLSNVAHADASGHFSLPVVEPGRYEYWAMMGNGTIWEYGSGIIAVPADAKGTFDVGAISYARGDAYDEFHLGQDEPASFGRTLDDEPIRLADYHGKFVVLVLWEGEAADTMKGVDPLVQAFATDQSVALIAINCNQQLSFHLHPQTLPGAAWINGYLPGADYALNSAYFMQTRPVIQIIGPNGKTVAAEVPVGEAAGRLRELLAGGR